MSDMPATINAFTSCSGCTGNDHRPRRNSRQPTFFNPNTNKSKKWNPKVNVGAENIPESPKRNHFAGFVTLNDNSKTGFGWGNVHSSTPKTGFGWGGNVNPKPTAFGFGGNVSPINTKEKVGFVTVTDTSNWFKTKEQHLEDENRKLREELLQLKETYLKEKNDLLERLDKKNDQIIELNDYLRHLS